MKCFVFTILCLALSAAIPLDFIEDVNGEQYYIVPVSREKRQTNWGISNTGFGASHRGTLFDNNRHRLDGTASAGKNFGSHGLRPDQIGGRLDYNHKPSGSSAFIGADRTRGWGTDVAAGGRYNIHQSKNFGVDLTGQYGRHFGGPGGTGKPEAGVFLNAHGRF
ncbi:attacin-A [Leptinotarsa decemlineata]|uniref:attacin-A n=1 Tax=Leptinotarsa decemlineata TaxID=7539 RepID=UPI000C251B3F|nr:attacin-B-like [Leptinotarsa decemlineata]